jgi:hypothetical protein
MKLNESIGLDLKKAYSEEIAKSNVVSQGGIDAVITANEFKNEIPENKKLKIIKRPMKKGITDKLVSKTKVNIVTVPVIEYIGGRIVQTGRKQFQITGNNIVVKNLLALEDTQDVGLFVATPGIDQEAKLEIGRLIANINSLYRYVSGRGARDLFKIVK